MDNPSVRLIDEQPDHGCDLCSRFRRRAVYQIARGLGANVIALGHTADDLCESFLRNARLTGGISELPPVTRSSTKEFLLSRSLVVVQEKVTTRLGQRVVVPGRRGGGWQTAGTGGQSIRHYQG